VILILVPALASSEAFDIEQLRCHAQFPNLELSHLFYTIEETFECEVQGRAVDEGLVSHVRPRPSRRSQSESPSCIQQVPQAKHEAAS